MPDLVLAGLAGAPVTVPDATVHSLRTALRGAVYAPGASQLDDGARIWNGMITSRPALVAQPLGASDVIACLRFAREHDRRAAPPVPRRHRGGAARAHLFHVAGALAEHAADDGAVGNRDARYVSAWWTRTTCSA
jgi:hypothetical protein